MYREKHPLSFRNHPQQALLLASPYPLPKLCECWWERGKHRSVSVEAKIFRKVICKTTQPLLVLLAPSPFNYCPGSGLLQPGNEVIYCGGEEGKNVWRISSEQVKVRCSFILRKAKGPL